MSDRFDAVVVGASVAGCTAAHLLARAGARVALVERRPDPDAYKVACTHAILSSASPTIRRLGLEPELEARGALRIHGDGWTPYGGWIRAPDDAPTGWGVTRRTLDPMLRDLAAGTPGVELLLGRTAIALLRDASGRPAGVEVEDRERRGSALRARLVVAADGRHSPLARMAGVPGRVRPNNRVAYFAYWHGVTPRTNRARVWMLPPDGAAHFPNEDDLTVLVAVIHRDRLPDFRADLDRNYDGFFAGLADGPDLRGAERVSKVIGVVDHRNVSRPAARPGIAFVGDAALASDPLFGVGLSWGLQSGAWLADEVGPALAGGDVDAALRRYRRRFRRELGLHHFLIADFSTGRPPTAPERIASRAAAANPRVARAFDDVFSRRHSPLRLFDPRLVPHVVRGLVSP